MNKFLLAALAILLAGCGTTTYYVRQGEPQLLNTIGPAAPQVVAVTEPTVRFTFCLSGVTLFGACLPGWNPLWFPQSNTYTFIYNRPQVVQQVSPAPAPANDGRNPIRRYP